MKLRNVLVCVTAMAAMCGLTGCPANGKLYPVEGPLAQQTPRPVFTVHGRVGLKLTRLDMVVAKGEKVSCAVSYSHGKPVGMTPESTTQFNFAPVWDTVYGDKFYQGKILGTREPYYWCDGTGDQGTVIHAALLWNGTGVAVDGSGDVFKVVF